MPKTFNNSDTCELAHNLTVKICNALHITYEEDEETYTDEGQEVFDIVHEYTENLQESCGLIKE